LNHQAHLWRLVPVALAALLLTAACRNFSSRPPEPPSPAPPLSQIIGRVRSFDAANKNVVVTLAPGVPLPENDTRRLVARDPETLATTATLSPLRLTRGRMAGAFVLSGSPRPDDEVAIPPP
jgi:hypothetical protein